MGVKPEMYTNLLTALGRDQNSIEDPGFLIRTDKRRNTEIGAESSSVVALFESIYTGERAGDESGVNSLISEDASLKGDTLSLASPWLFSP